MGLVKPTLAGYCNLGYQFDSHGGDHDPAPDCARDIPRLEITAEFARLQPMVDRRDHISGVWQAFLRRCLDVRSPT